MMNQTIKPVCVFCTEPLSKKLIEDIEKDGKSYDIYFCSKCAVGTLSPVMTLNELSAFYSSGSYRASSGTKFNKLLERLVYIFRLRRKRRIKKYVGKGNILDVGCGRGLFLTVMRNDGWDVMGTEFNEETASYASAVYGVQVRTGAPLHWGLRDESFDVITINHALEHILNPEETLRACRRLLKKGGLLVIAAPNISSLQASAGGKKWFHLDIPYHLLHFSEKGLVCLLQKGSFQISRIRRFDLEYNPFGWLQTLLNLSGIRENFLYNFLKNEEIRKHELAKAGAADAILTLILLPFYVPLSMVLSLFESFILKRGGTVEVYAVKK